MQPPGNLPTLLLSLLLASLALGEAGLGVPINPNLYPEFPWCVATTTVAAGDTCYKIASEHHMAIDDFLRWNPKMQQHVNPCNSLTVGRVYCVSVQNLVTSFPPRTTPPPPPNTTPPPTTPPPPPPSRTPEGYLTPCMVENTVHTCDCGTKMCTLWE